MPIFHPLFIYTFLIYSFSYSQNSFQGKNFWVTLPDIIHKGMSTFSYSDTLTLFIETDSLANVIISVPRKSFYALQVVRQFVLNLSSQDR